MIVRVRLFAAARQLAEADEIQVDLPEESTFGQLRTAMLKRWPALAAVLPHSLFAVGSDYVDDQAAIPLAPADIACIPPVSGG